jgi:TolB-like protein
MTVTGGLAAALVLAFGLAPGALLGQCPDGTPLPCGPARPASGSVAVLDFLNESRDTTDAYLAAGFTDEITTRLSQVGRLTVTSRTAVRRLPNAATLTPQALGRTLNVAYLVSGVVRRGVGRVRVSVELLRATTGVTVWSSQYDRGDGDVLQIEGDLATAVAGAIAGRLLPAERAALAVRPTSSATAYDHFLRGNYYLAQRTGAATQRAISEYDSATALDPRFVQARARTAYAYGLYLDWGWPHPGVTDDSMVASGMREADLVLQQDSLLSDGWMARAYLLSHRDRRRLAGADAAFERAIALDPRNAEACHQYAWTLLLLGRDSAAAAMYRRSLAVDPTRAITLDELSLIYLVHHDYLEARVLEDSALALDTTAFWVLNDRAHIRLLLGDLSGARTDAEAARRYGPPGFTYWGEAVLAILAAREGDTTWARGTAGRLARETSEPGRPTVQEGRWISAALAAVGEREAAVAFLLSIPTERRGALLAFFMRFPELAPLRGDPRFQRLMADSRPPGPLER